MMRSEWNGPRSLIRTTTLRPLARLVTRDVARDRQRRMRRGHRVHVVGLAARGGRAVEAPAVPAADPGLPERRHARRPARSPCRTPGRGGWRSGAAAPPSAPHRESPPDRAADSRRDRRPCSTRPCGEALRQVQRPAPASRAAHRAWIQFRSPQAGTGKEIRSRSSASRCEFTPAPREPLEFAPSRSMPAVILGLASSHDASACVFIDGALAAAVSQERITRRKNDGCRLPLEAMEHALEVAGIAPHAGRRRRADAQLLPGKVFPPRIARQGSRGAAGRARGAGCRAKSAR